MVELSRCRWCEQRTEEGESYCSARCKLAWHNQRSRETGWLLLTLVRQLWGYRPEGWVYEAEEFPGVGKWRKEWNGFGEWVRAQIKEGRDGAGTDSERGE